MARLGARLDGLIAWSSNRSGNHELYLLDLRARRLRQLTNHPHVDFYARFSPDGRRIVFVLSQRPWVCFRDPTAWDVYVIGVDGGDERRLARNGYSPMGLDPPWKFTPRGPSHEPSGRGRRDPVAPHRSGWECETPRRLSTRRSPHRLHPSTVNQS